MTNLILTPLEKCLCLLVSFVLLASITLALCICLILPRHWTTEGYVTKNADNLELLSAICNCGQIKYTSNCLDCKEHVLPKRTNKREGISDDCQKIENYPFLVSFNVPAYADERNERRFLGVGTIVTEQDILVGFDNDWKQSIDLKARAGSVYWSKGGTEYNVEIPENDIWLFVLRVAPNFTFGKFISPSASITSASYANWTNAVSLGWNGDVSKHSKFTSLGWHTTPCAKCSCYTGELAYQYVPKRLICQRQEFGNPLVTTTKIVLGPEEIICYDECNIRRHLFARISIGFFFDDLREVPENNQTSYRRSIPVQLYERKGCVLMDPDE